MDEINQSTTTSHPSGVPPPTNILYELTLEDNEQKSKKDTTKSIQCMQCDQCFNFPSSKDDYLAHLFLEHRLVIADVDDIGNLEEYLEYWTNEFKGHELHDYCSTVLLDQLPDGTPAKNEKYYLLSDLLPADFELRKQLHRKRLEEVLTQYQFERSDRTFSRECLYCRDVIKGLRANYIEHLYNKHFLQLGKSENLVFVDELINVVQNKLENLICIFCEKIFKDRATLKEHMRKKGHKRINPDIVFYDKFYLENYKIEKPKHVKSIKKQNVCRNKSRTRYNSDNCRSKQQGATCTGNREKRLFQQSDEDDDNDNDRLFHNKDESDSDWTDWDGEQILLKCFFCNVKDTDFSRLKKHLLTSHNMDFDALTKSLTFYQRIKVVNYIRRQMYILNCVTCNEHFNKLEELQNHMTENQHYGIGDKKRWDRPEYFFPTYEDDGLLYLLDDDNNDEFENIGDASVAIISEDLKVSINKDAEALSMERFEF